MTTIEHKIHDRSLINMRNVFFAGAMVVIYLVFDVLLDTYAFGRGDLWHGLFGQGIQETWMRLVTSGLIVFAFYNRLLIRGYRKMRESTQKEEEQYRLLFENNPFPMWVYDLETHSFLAVNTAAIVQYGYSREDFLSMTIRDIRPPEDVPALLDRISKLSQGIERTMSWRHRKKDGTLIDVDVTSDFMYFNGRRARLVLVTDVTERKKMQEQVFQIKQDWEETFNTLTDMITIHDKNFNIIRANKAAEKILGLPFLDMTEAKCFEYYHGTGCPPEACPSCQCLRTGTPSTNEMFEPHINKFIEIRAIPRFDSRNNLTGLIHVVRDITDRRKLEEQLFQAQKMESIGQLAGGIAHDFNNILSAIIGYGHLLIMKMKDDEPLRPHVEQILAASDRAANLTQSLLAFSRKQVITLNPLSLSELIRKIEKLLLRLIREDIELKVMPSDPDVNILADSVQIEQVLMNLVTNARDAMPDGGRLTIRVENTIIDEDFIKAHSYGKTGHYALITVEDTGSGMDERTREKIFEPFFTTKELGRGTGLGLSMVYGIIRQHEGFINVYSEPGKGTTFRIYLPSVRAEVMESEEASAVMPNGGTETILVAEDDPVLRKLTRTVLEDSGYHVIDAVDGEDALVKFKDHQDSIQAVILDVIMPKKNGKEVYESIKAINPGIKTIFASGYTADVIQLSGIPEKDVMFIYKPISPKDLLGKIREVLN
ncbi:MAG: PAS domain S-box protein [Nitrospirae bacterium]|nr:PAS domain S-box protein [Nitrospirota bacterium]